MFRTISGGLLACAVGAARAAEAPSGLQPLDLTGAFNVVIALVVVLAVFFLVMLAMRRYTGIRSGGTGTLRIVDGLMLGVRDRIVLVQVGDDQVLLGLTPGRIQPLHVVRGKSAGTPEFSTELAARIASANTPPEQT
jgi:flagellar protein FliO/FliZ